MTRLKRMIGQRENAISIHPQFRMTACLRCKAIHTVAFDMHAQIAFSLIRFLRTNRDAFERSLAIRSPLFPKVLHRRQKMTLTSLRHVVRDSNSSVAMLPLMVLLPLPSLRYNVEIRNRRRNIRTSLHTRSSLLGMAWMISARVRPQRGWRTWRIENQVSGLPTIEQSAKILDMGVL